jgi:hypothetical protein
VVADRKLTALSRVFAEAVQHVLNSTICNNVRIGTTISADPSVVSIGYGVRRSSVLCRLDYDRGKQGYPESHLQIKGESAALAAWSGKPRRELERLHFPMGGRRYRPILEDFIEFLILEGLAEARPGWRDVLDAARVAYHRVQLRAAIRRDPWTALDAIGDPLFA